MGARDGLEMQGEQWSALRGTIFALSPPRPGFDSPSGK